MAKPTTNAYLLLAILAATSASPPPVAALSRTYLCFFEPASATISPRCRMIIGELAGAWRRAANGQAADYRAPLGPPLRAVTASIEVRGYAEDATSPGGNDMLSLARATAAAAELRGFGVPGKLVHPVGYGAKEPFVPDSPMDPQNRRVLFVLR